jgi:hypothetical protein
MEKGLATLVTKPEPLQTKNKHRYGWSLRSHRSFAVDVSVFRGTPPPKPFKCKIRDRLAGRAHGRSWAHHAGGKPKLAFAKISFAPADIIQMSRCS